MLSIFPHERYYSSPFHVRVGKSGLLHLAHLLSGDVSQVHFICNLCCGCRRSLLQSWSLFFIFSLRCCRHKLFDYLAHVRLVFSLLLSADFSFYRQFYLWNVDAILFQAELPSFVKATVGSRLALCPLAIVVFYPHSIINIILLFDQGSTILILSSYWIRNYFVDRSVDTIFISGRSRIWSRRGAVI